MNDFGTALLIGAVAFTAGVTVAAWTFEENPVDVYKAIGKSTVKAVTTAKDGVVKMINDVKGNNDQKRLTATVQPDGCTVKVN